MLRQYNAVTGREREEENSVLIISLRNDTEFDIYYISPLTLQCWSLCRPLIPHRLLALVHRKVVNAWKYTPNLKPLRPGQ